MGLPLRYLKSAVARWKVRVNFIFSRRRRYAVLRNIDLWDKDDLFCSCWYYCAVLSLFIVIVLTPAVQLVMNAALGFDTFVVLRHGFRGPLPPSSTLASAESAAAASNVTDALSGRKINGRDLGCYFCNDIVAPGDVSR